MNLVVSGITCFPVKSCRGITLRKAEVDSAGIVHNRRWMIVDEHGMFVAQRAYEHKKEGIAVRSLALIQPSIENGLLKLSAPDMGSCFLPLAGNDEEKITTSMWQWGDPISTFDQGKAVSLWLSDFLSQERKGIYRLARLDPSYVRKSRMGQGRQGLDDGYPFMIISEESREWLNSHMPEALPMNRFRPQIVIRGGIRFAEDRLAKIKIGDVVLEGQTLCMRCDMTRVNQDTGIHDKSTEPLWTLSQYRKTDEHKVMFGRNFNHLNPGTIYLFDYVEVLEEADPPVVWHPNIKTII